MVQINTKLLPMKGHYFLFNAGTAPVVPFLPTLAKQLGFSSVVTGTIYTILPITGMLVKPIFGMIGDRWQCHKSLLIIAQIIVAVSLFSIMFIPEIKKNPTIEFSCNNGMNDIKYCPAKPNVDQYIINKLKEHKNNNETLQCNFNCEILNRNYWNIICDHWGVFDKSDCPYNNETIDMSIYLSVYHLEDIKSCLYFIVHKAEINEKLRTKLYCQDNDTILKTICEMECSDNDYVQRLITTNVEHNEISKTHQFWMFFILSVINWCAMAVVVSTADAMCFVLLDDKPNLYGYQRLWGAVGWGTLSIISGFLIDLWSDGSVQKDYTIAFYMALIIMLADAAVSTKLDCYKRKLSTNIFKDVGKLLLLPCVLIFFLWCCTVGLCTALVWNYLFWYLEELGDQEENCNNNSYMKTLQGLVMGIQCFGGELPFLFLSKWIFKKIGHIHSMSLVLAAFSMRFILYFTLKNPWWVLPIEFMNGLTYGIFYTAMASYASIIAPLGTEATLQGLVGAVFEGVGVSLGSLFGGILFKMVGGSKTFLLYGSISLVAFFVHVIIQWFLEKNEKRHGKTLDTSSHHSNNKYMNRSSIFL